MSSYSKLISMTYIHRSPSADLPPPGEEPLHQFPQRSLQTGPQPASTSFGEQHHHQAGDGHLDWSGGPQSPLPHRERHQSCVTQGSGPGQWPWYAPPGRKQAEGSAHWSTEQGGKPQRPEAVWEFNSLGGAECFPAIGEVTEGAVSG